MVNVLTLDLACLGEHLGRKNGPERTGWSVQEVRAWLNAVGFQQHKRNWLCLNAHLPLVSKHAICKHEMVEL